MCGFIANITLEVCGKLFAKNNQHIKNIYYICVGIKSNTI